MRRPWSAKAAWPLAGALTVFLAAAPGCTNLFHSDAKPDQTYVLRAPALAPAPAPGSASAQDAEGAGAGAGATATADPGAGMLASLQVAHPIVAPGLDGPRIILVQPDHRMNFYVGSRWPAPLPDMLEALTVETLRASGQWQSVQDSASPFTSEYLLSVSVRRFEADYTRRRSAPQVEVVLDCTLGARGGRELVASFTAEGSAAAAGDHMSEVITAFESASSAALSSLTQQTAAATRAFAGRRTATAQ